MSKKVILGLLVLILALALIGCKDDEDEGDYVQIGNPATVKTLPDFRGVSIWAGAPDGVDRARDNAFGFVTAVSALLTDSANLSVNFYPNTFPKDGGYVTGTFTANNGLFGYVLEYDTTAYNTYMATLFTTVSTAVNATTGTIPTITFSENFQTGDMPSNSASNYFAAGADSTGPYEGRITGTKNSTIQVTNFNTSMYPLIDWAAGWGVQKVGQRSKYTMSGNMFLEFLDGTVRINPPINAATGIQLSQPAILVDGTDVYNLRGARIDVKYNLSESLEKKVENEGVIDRTEGGSWSIIVQLSFDDEDISGGSLGSNGAKVFLSIQETGLAGDRGKPWTWDRTMFNDKRKVQSNLYILNNSGEVVHEYPHSYTGMTALFADWEAFARAVIVQATFSPDFYEGF